MNTKPATNAYQFSFNGLDGQLINLSDLKGRVILVINTASKCGFTPQYQALQELHLKYKDQGLAIIGVPSADFGNQEFQDSEQIKNYICQEFAVTFLMSQPETVKGKDAHPFYLWANSQAGFIGSPKWNFHKYIIDKQGRLAEWFSSITKPDSPKIISTINNLL